MAPDKALPEGYTREDDSRNLALLVQKVTQLSEDVREWKEDHEDRIRVLEDRKSVV